MFSKASLAFLSSPKNDVVTAISVEKVQDEPLQCQMPSRALPSTAPESVSVPGRTFFRHPIADDYLGLIELSDEGSIHYQELRYTVEAPTNSTEQRDAAGRLNCQWSDEIHSLERQSKELKPYYGNLSERAELTVDMSGLHEGL